MTKIYYADFSCEKQDNLSFKDFGEERKDYLSSITNKNRFLQSFYCWKLLLYALNLHKIDFSCGFCQNKNGAWRFKDENLKIYFSLSHCETVVVVAVSDFPVGVDTEKYSQKILFLCDKYKGEIDPNNKEDKISALIKLWTEKESVYKVKSAKFLNFYTIENNTGEKFGLSVAGKDKITEIIKTEKFN